MQTAGVLRSSTWFFAKIFDVLTEYCKRRLLTLHWQACMCFSALCHMQDLCLLIGPLSRLLACFSGDFMQMRIARHWKVGWKRTILRAFLLGKLSIILDDAGNRFSLFMRVCSLFQYICAGLSYTIQKTSALNCARQRLTRYNPAAHLASCQPGTAVSARPTLDFQSRN